jgi:N-acetylglucosaminyl-diphospho-decaprenol L-rhamnosyltransferase
MIVAVPLDLAVQIVNYRTKEHLGPCLGAVLDDLRTTSLEHRVLVLDNASGDDLADLAEVHRDDPVEFHAAARNGGFGAGQNALAARHDAAALLLLNPDALVTPGTVAGLHALLAEPGVAAAGPRLAGADGRVHGWDHGELHGARARLAAAAGHSRPRERGTRTDVAWVSGACAAVSRAWFDAVGGFDPGFFLYKEEEDLFLRMRRLGARIVYEPALRVLHHQSVTGARGEHLDASVRRYRDKHVRTRVGRAVLPPLHRGVVAWEGRLRRARSLVRPSRPPRT